MFQNHQQYQLNGADLFNYLDNETQEKMLSRGVSGDDLLALLNVKHEAYAMNHSVQQETDTTNPEEIKRKYDALLQHQQELETRIQHLVNIIINEEQPLPQCDLSFNYDDMATQFGEILMQRPVKRARNNHTSPMDTSPVTPVQAIQQPIQQVQSIKHASPMQAVQPTLSVRHPSPQVAQSAQHLQQTVQQQQQQQSVQQQPLFFSQERRQQLLQQQQTESLLTNFSPQLQVDPFWQMNFLNTNTPTGLCSSTNDELSSTPITRKRSNSEPGFGLIAFNQMNSNGSKNNNNNTTNTPPKSLTPNSVQHPLAAPSVTRRRRSNSDAVVFVDEISKARDSHQEKVQKQTDQKRLVEQQGGYNRDKKKRKYDNMMTFFKFR